MVSEPLADCAARGVTRQWVNPAAEIEHMVTLSAFLAAWTAPIMSALGEATAALASWLKDAG
ncbi:MAG: hypothetical protein JWP65_3933 [Ramlibacter sp.]|jgi:hypothetical protein|uniref:hypothetical protein n=1 Tax=Ramlibacter sp. TaxID=1917967 RepID=UPI0026173ADB|nr:hypothetical protein [Ramlibacter sp.]MDB5753512.1 hypothetical protein [Ramlibacter sp.]